MDVDSDEQGISFDMTPDEADDVAIYLSRFKPEGNEPFAIRQFRAGLLKFCNSRVAYHEKFAKAKGRRS